MKFIHLSDLHIGKRVNEFSMLDDQAHILSQILRIVDDERPDGVLIAGDVYDKTVPSAEAVALCDTFLCELASKGVPTFLISGNHDSPERLAFGGRLMTASGVHVSPVYAGDVAPVYLQDEFGTVAVWLLPFVKPAHVRRFAGDTPIDSYTDAIRVAVENMAIDPAHRNVLVTHQFVTGGQRCESEEVSVGGSDNVDASVFDGFDYVALGHLHGPQSVGRDTVRYCGTPLKYSFSETAHRKSVTVVELGEKGDTAVRTVDLTPLRDLRELRGTYDQLTARATYENTATTDYLHITLTDEEDVPDALGKLRCIYPNLMKLDYDNTRTRKTAVIDGADAVESKLPLDLFAEFFELQNNAPMTDEQTALVQGLIETIWEGER